VTTSDQTFAAHVRGLEAGLAAYAFTSEKASTFLDGTDVAAFYERQWNSDGGRARLRNRTPLMIERDRILYSHEMRRMTDKYHILYQGSDRILRNYTTQTLRTAHVARSVASALRLNAHFAEGLALGAKVGAVPFVHRAKHVADVFMREKIAEIDRAQEGARPAVTDHSLQAELFTDEQIPLPAWVQIISDNGVASHVARFVPWAAGDSEGAAYSSGQESYWLLTTDVFLRRPRNRSFLPQTMYGIWQHSMGATARPGSFVHRSRLWRGDHYTGITWEHATHEAHVVQYADDITWVIENLSDANTAAALAGKGNDVYTKLASYLGRNHAPEAVINRVNDRDSGGLYTYFIADLITSSEARFAACREVAPTPCRDALLVALSDGAQSVLDTMVKFLESSVFADLRVVNRNRMVAAITQACLEILYDGDLRILERFIESRSLVEGWLPDDRQRAVELLNNPVHRAQLAIDILASMSDREVYDFAGLEVT